MSRVAPEENLLQVPSRDSTGSRHLHNHGTNSPRGSIAIVSIHPPSECGSYPSEAIAGRQSTVQKTRANVRHFYAYIGWTDSRVQAMLKRLMKRRLFNTLTMICLIFALFFPQVLILAAVPENEPQDVVLCIVLFVFVFEFTCNFLTDPDFLFSFFFWMDFLGTVSLLMDISYCGLVDASKIQESSSQETSSQPGVVVSRVARAAKLAARAGRLSRVMKLVRYQHLCRRDDKEGSTRIAKVISKQLTNALAVRVAFLAIGICVVLPIFSLFTYPENDDSLSAWTMLLNRDAKLLLDAYYSGNLSLTHFYQDKLERELRRCSSAYESLNYGPFDACVGSQQDNGWFRCNLDAYNRPLDWKFRRPIRNSFIRQVNEDFFTMFFDLESPYQDEAAAGIGSVVFIIITMLIFGLLTSHRIGIVALQPLERMLHVVRERCSQIFTFTDELNEEDVEDDNKHKKETHNADLEKASEFDLLDTVVGKLAAVVKLTTTKPPEVNDNMNEQDLVVINWMQGANRMSSDLSRFDMVKYPPVHTSDSLDSAVEESHGAATINLIPVATKEALDTDHFDSLALTKEETLNVAAYIISTYIGSQHWVLSKISQPTLSTFLTEIKSRYLDNPFHNFAHGVDVTYVVARQLSLVGAGRFLSEMEQFSLLVAAVAHDLGHIGLNNQFLVESSHELAVKYNDRSPLENLHCSMLFQVVTEPKANIFVNVSKEHYKEMRKSIIGVILHTDIVKHNEMCKELALLYQMSSENFDSLRPDLCLEQSASNKQLIMNAFLHGADVGNPMKPWPLCEKLAYACLDEFFAQGDLEKASGMTVQMLNDRDKVSRPNSQIGFIEFLICPFVVAMVQLFPQLDSQAIHLSDNVQSWFKVWQSDASTTADAIGKVAGRVDKVAGKLRAVTRSGRGIIT